ncbi:MAG: septum formation initiator family protein [Leptospirillia bacterium]
MTVERKNRRARKGPSTSRRMLFWGGIGLFSVYLLFFLVFGRMGLVAHLRLEDEADRIETEIARSQAQIAELSETVESLTRNPHAIERIARERLGMARPGETVFLFDPPDSQAGLPADGSP